MKNPRGNYPSCAGTTATVVLITDDKVICANAGDSRTVYGTGWNSDGKAGKGIPLSQDHKPDDAAEKKRIEAANGYVEQGRVFGTLAVSRALGDFDFKKEEVGDMF